VLLLQQLPEHVNSNSYIQMLYEATERWPLLRRAISIRAEGKRLVEKHAIASAAASAYRLNWFLFLFLLTDFLF
jgi:hypothetical protein